MSHVAVVGSRVLPASWAARVDSVVGSLLARGLFIGSGGAVGADLFALRSLVRRGQPACSGSVVFLPRVLGSAPCSCVSWLSRFVRLGGRVVAGPASGSASRRDFVSALFARSRSLVSGSVGVVAFVSGRSAGSWFSVSVAAGLGLPIVVFPVEGPRALRSLGAGRWVRLRCWAGAFRWVPARADKTRCIHGLIGSFCSICVKGGRS
ncbi:MAG: DNA-processing protein DprA [Deltaproteobacteria bacterium]|nr:DNA-processing protein DprA [Deltaproteobacteria bacterium]